VRREVMNVDISRNITLLLNKDHVPNNSSQTGSHKYNTHTSTLCFKIIFPPTIRRPPVYSAMGIAASS
jgi:hypothetical protein